MKPGKLLLLPLAISALSGVSATQAQNSEELDITITVIQEGETPAGFINRLELPPLELLATEAEALAVEENVTEAVESVAEQVDDATETVSDSIREAISIDGNPLPGTGQGDQPDIIPEVVNPVPEQIVDILDPDLPLQDTLEEVSEQLGDVAGGGDLVDLPPVDGDTADEVVDDIVDNVGDSAGDTADSVDDLVQDSTSSVSDGVTGSTQSILDDSFGDTVGTPIDDLPDDELSSPPEELLESADEQMTIDDITEQLPGL